VLKGKEVYCERMYRPTGVLLNGNVVINFRFELLLLTYLLTPFSRFLLEKLIVFQLVKKFPEFCGSRKFITAFVRAHHLLYSERG